MPRKRIAPPLTFRTTIEARALAAYHRRPDEEAPPPSYAAKRAVRGRTFVVVGNIAGPLAVYLERGDGVLMRLSQMPAWAAEPAWAAQPAPARERFDLPWAAVPRSGEPESLAPEIDSTRTNPRNQLPTCVAEENAG